MFERVTIAVELNPADPERLAACHGEVFASVKTPSGKTCTIPGFLYQPFTRKIESGVERLTPAGPVGWQIRLALREPGAHSVTVAVAVPQGGAWTIQPCDKPLEIMATQADAPGYIRRSPADYRYFVTDRGESFFPLGANVCWAGRGGTYDYDRWLPQYAREGCNYWRAWLSPEWTTFGLNTRESGCRRIDLANAWRLDQAIEQSERLGLRVLLCIDSFNILQSHKQQYGEWESSVFNKANGGPCLKPADYFTDPEMLQAYRDRLRYLVARWGYSPSVFAWEFWNEVDGIDDYRSDRVAAWHRDMARYLRNLDPWQHLITTSTGNSKGDPQLDALPELDFVQSHHYAGGDVVAYLDEDRRTKAAARDRPHYHGEFGLNAEGGFERFDPTGIHLHNALYASVGQEQAGTPMTWYWDDYIEPQKLYPIYGSFARWIAGFDFVAQKPRRIQAEIVYARPADAVIPEASPLIPTEGSWSPAPFNQPVAVTVDRLGGLSSDRPLAHIMHSLKGHKELYNPATFDLDAPAAATFGVLIEGVSGWGGGGLEISLDGQAVLKRDFPNTNKGDDHATLMQYNKAYRIALPAGRHKVKVEDTGHDWITVGYEIPWRVAGPPLRVYGLAGSSRALVWVQNRHYRYDRPAGDKTPSPTVADARLLLPLPPGTWTVEFWETQSGAVTATQKVTVAADGRAEIALPPITWDAALRLRLESR
ncbi:MAG: hypothetical protein ACLQVA_15015 [Candidatus Brocadiia bacterium]